MCPPAEPTPVPRWFPWHPAAWPAATPATWQRIFARTPTAPADGVGGLEAEEGWVWLADPERWPAWQAHIRRLSTSAPSRWTVVTPGSEPALDPPAGWRAVAGYEVLSWEREPGRGVLHDPPMRVQPLSVDRYLALRQAWPRAEVPGPRVTSVIRRAARELTLQAYMLGETLRRPTIALLLWAPGPSLAYIVDVVWAPQVNLRTWGRYLFQDLYLHHREARFVLDVEPVHSPLNPVLAALGYRVYRRGWVHRWVRPNSQVTGQ